MARQGEGSGAIGAAAWIHPAATVKILINERKELPPVYMQAIQAMTIDSTWDGADMVRFEVLCSTTDGGVIWRDEPWLQFPQTVDIWAGYGVPDTPMGRFYMKRSEFQNGPQGVTATLVGYDKLERFMHHKGPRLMKGYTRTSDVVKDLVEEYEIGQTKIDETKEIKTLRRIVKRGKKAVNLPPDHHKPAGDTDLRFLKLMAAGNDFLYPYVRLSGDVNTGASETFYWHPPNFEQQKTEIDRLQFRYSLAGGHNTIEQFNPSWSVAGLPTAVRVTMMVEPGVWVTVERMLVEATGEVIGLNAFAGPSPPKVNAKVAQWDTSKKADPKAAYVSVLTSGKVKEAPGGPKGRRKGKKKKEKRLEYWGRDVAIAFKMSPGGMSPVELADAWLLSRAKLGIAGRMSVNNLVGSQRLLANQIHAVVGVGGRDSGWYIVHKAVHTFRGRNHRAMLSLERQAGKLEVG